MSDLTSFRHFTPTSTVLAGAGSIVQLPGQLELLGIRRPLLVCGRRTAESSLFGKTCAALGNMQVALFTELPAHAPIEAVSRLRDLAASHHADGFIAVGGGSVSDACKAASIWLAEGGALEDCATRFVPPATVYFPNLRASKLPIVAIPSTASGAEVTASAGIKAGDHKLLITDPKVASRLIVIDPDAGLDTPADLLLRSGMNALAHCLEGVYSKVRSPVTTALALYATSLLAGAMPAVFSAPESVEARGRLMAAAHLAGAVLLNARTCLHHAICHALGASTGLSHGEANSVMLPHVVRFNAELPEVAELLRPAIFNLDPTAEGVAAMPDALMRLQRAIGVPTRLRDCGVLQAQLPKVADVVMKERGVYFNPRPIPDAGTVEQLLNEAW